VVHGRFERAGIKKARRIPKMFLLIFNPFFQGIRIPNENLGDLLLLGFLKLFSLIQEQSVLNTLIKSKNTGC
jgi:hypothetical protein